MSAIADHTHTGRAVLAPLARSDSGEYLSFRLGGEEYGIAILKVQEIRSYQWPTRLAGAPSHVAGILNLRGAIVPIVDLRQRFGLEPTFDAATVTVVLQVADHTVGLVVDSVSDVSALSANQIKPTPEFNGSIDANHIAGIGCLKSGDAERLLILLDIDRLVLDLGLTNESQAEAAF